MLSETEWERSSLDESCSEAPQVLHETNITVRQRLLRPFEGAILAWTDALTALEGFGKAALSRVSDRCGDFGHRQIGSREQFARSVHAKVAQVLLGRFTFGLPEHPGELRCAHAGDAAELFG